MSTLDEYREKMDKAIEFLKDDIATIRTGRASPAMVENVSISAYGGQSRLQVKEMGTITTQDARTLIIQSWDTSVVGDIVKGIQGANLGLTPVVDGEIIRISVPALSEERREEYVKLLKAKLEGGRVAIRQIRRDRMSEIKRQFEEKVLNEDDKRREEEELQKLTDEMNEKIAQIGEKKEQEIREI